MAEMWKKIPSHVDYSVSSNGRVRRNTPAKGTRPGLILRQHETKRRLFVRLSIATNVSKKFYVHRLVALAFLGKPLVGQEVNHRDTNPRNNNLSNLEYLTRSQNALHAHHCGVAHSFPSGVLNMNSKLTEVKVAKLRFLARQGVRTGVLVKRFGVTPGHVRKIVRKEIWRGAIS